MLAQNVYLSLCVCPAQFILYIRYRKSRQVCPRCNHEWSSEVPASVMNLKKVILLFQAAVVIFDCID